jgi:hypothetical protein
MQLMAKQRRENGLSMGVLQTSAIPGNTHFFTYKEEVAGSIGHRPLKKYLQAVVFCGYGEKAGTRFPALLLRGEADNREVPMFAKADEPDAASVVFVARENYVLRGCRTRN